MNQWTWSIDIYLCWCIVTDIYFINITPPMIIINHWTQLILSCNNSFDNPSSDPCIYRGCYGGPSSHFSWPNKSLLYPLPALQAGSSVFRFVKRGFFLSKLMRVAYVEGSEGQSEIILLWRLWFFSSLF